MKKRTKGLLALIMAGMLMITWLCIPLENVRAYNQDVSSGVVAIVFYLKSGKYAAFDQNGKILHNFENISGGLSAGSGFFVGNIDENPQFIVTNEHVIDDYLASGEGGTFYYPVSFYEQGTYGVNYYEGFVADECELRIYYSENDYDVAFIDSYGDMEKVDLAVLKIRNATNKRHALPIKVPTDDMVGETVYTVGFPGNADNEYTNASKYGVNDVTVHKGSITKFVANTGVGVERIAIDATIQHGNSGGPLVDEEGYVIGVNTNVESNILYQEQVEADYYAINSSELVRFLDKNSVTYQTAYAPATPDQANDSNGDDNNETDVTVPVEMPVETRSTSSGSGMNTGLIIAIIVILAAAVIAFILMKNKKGKGSSGSVTQAVSPQPVGSMPQPAVSAQPITQIRAMLRSLSTQHNGMTVAIHSTPVLIGRDPANCKVVFQKDTTGVSGRHCSVTFDTNSGDFILTDLRSTYGTFLTNGQKLNANVPYHLKAGDGFYVGDPANAFRVEMG